MKIAVTGDNHIQHIGNARPVIERLLADIRAEHADVLCVVGDLGEGEQAGADPLYDLLLGTHPNTLFVLGNHDLWGYPHAKEPPPESMERSIAHFRSGFLLERAWDDTETLHVAGDCAFVGSMGFPDFAHPRLEGKRDFYDSRSATVDHEFIWLPNGWVTHTDHMMRAFAKRLLMAFQRAAKHVVVLTHYPILDGQSHLIDEPRELQVWPYFFNWTMGRTVFGLAKEHPQKTAWCLAGHSHEFCRGKLTQEAANVFSFGLKTSYRSQDFLVFDTNQPGAGRNLRST